MPCEACCTRRCLIQMLPVSDTVGYDAYKKCALRLDRVFHLINNEGPEPPGRAVFLRIANRIEGRILGRVIARIREPVIVHIWP